MLAYQSVVSKVTKLSQSLKRKLMGTKDLERAYESGCDAYRSKAEAFPNRISPQRNGLPLRFIFPFLRGLAYPHRSAGGALLLTPCQCPHAQH